MRLDYREKSSKKAHWRTIWVDLVKTCIYLFRLPAYFSGWLSLSWWRSGLLVVSWMGSHQLLGWGFEFHIQSFALSWLVDIRCIAVSTAAIRWPSIWWLCCHSLWSINRLMHYLVGFCCLLYFYWSSNPSIMVKWLKNFNIMKKLVLSFSYALRRWHNIVYTSVGQSTYGKWI